MQAKVETYSLKALSGSGRHVRKATQVMFSDGRTVRFVERMSKRRAIQQASAILAREER